MLRGKTQGSDKSETAIASERNRRKGRYFLRTPDHRDPPGPSAPTRQECLGANWQCCQNTQVPPEPEGTRPHQPHWALELRPLQPPFRRPRMNPPNLTRNLRKDYSKDYSGIPFYLQGKKARPTQGTRASGCSNSTLGTAHRRRLGKRLGKFDYPTSQRYRSFARPTHDQNEGSDLNLSATRPSIANRSITASFQVANSLSYTSILLG